MAYLSAFFSNLLERLTKHVGGVWKVRDPDKEPLGLKLTPMSFTREPDDLINSETE